MVRAMVVAGEGEEGNWIWVGSQWVWAGLLGREGYWSGSEVRNWARFWFGPGVIGFGCVGVCGWAGLGSGLGIGLRVGSGSGLGCGLPGLRELGCESRVGSGLGQV